MQHLINQKLSSLEAEHQVKIIFACESGSRAWGFASPDSDYDIRFIYKNNPNWYLSLWQHKDTIEFMTAEDLDGSGWDLAKALRLLAKSNMALYEWIYSPVQYQADSNFLQGLYPLAETCFSPVAAMYHYLSTTKGFLDAVRQDHIRLKHLFYALRTALCGKWIVEFKTMPPVAFEELLVLVDDDMKAQIHELIHIKSQQGEKYLHLKNKHVDAYLTELVHFNETHARGLPAGEKASEALDDFFKSVLRI
jgi:predicted nucleotidyltransferase